MTPTSVELTGVLRPDGTLILDGRPDLPPGRVRVIVETAMEVPSTDPFFQMLQQIWAQRQAAGLTPRPTEEVEAERRASRDEVDREIDAAGRLQQQSPPE